MKFLQTFLTTIFLCAALICLAVGPSFAQDMEIAWERFYVHRDTSEYRVTWSWPNTMFATEDGGWIFSSTVGESEPPWGENWRVVTHHYVWRLSPEGEVQWTFDFPNVEGRNLFRSIDNRYFWCETYSTGVGRAPELTFLNENGRISRRVQVELDNFSVNKGIAMPEGESLFIDSRGRLLALDINNSVISVKDCPDREILAPIDEELFASVDFDDLDLMLRIENIYSDDIESYYIDSFSGTGSDGYFLSVLPCGDLVIGISPWARDRDRVCLMRVTSQGELVWRWNYNDDANPLTSAITALQILEDGRIVIALDANYHENGGKAILFSQEGEVLSELPLEGFGYAKITNFVQQPDGRLIFLGTTLSYLYVEEPGLPGELDDDYYRHELFWMGEIELPNSAPSDILAPVQFNVHVAYPNPFNSTTTIGYSLSVAGNVSLAVYDLRGREVTRLVDGLQPAGTHEAVWTADGVSSGVYVVKMTAGEKTKMSKVVLVK